MNTRLRLLIMLATAFTQSTISHANTIAYYVPAGTVGNQLLPAREPQSLGMDFDVNSRIQITALGVFDSGSDGLRAPLTAHIYDRDSRLSLVQITFTPAAPGTLVGGSRFLELDIPLVLDAGFHGVIAVDYVAANNEPNGNLRVGPGGWTTDSGGGLISFVGSGRHSFMGTGAVFPDILVPPGPADCFAAGTFQFERVPDEGATAVLVTLGVGVAWLLKLAGGWIQARTGGQGGLGIGAG